MRDPSEDFYFSRVELDGYDDGEVEEQEFMSGIKTPYAVHCRIHGLCYLTEKQYKDQMLSMDERWHCPICGRRADWDDENAEQAEPVHECGAVYGERPRFNRNELLAALAFVVVVLGALGLFWVGNN